jgi:adhesin transport system outer membrane protein
LMDFGTGDKLRAADAAKSATDRKVVQSIETANRAISALKQKLSAERNAAEDARALTDQAKANLDLFQSQYEGGQRQIMDVVGVYETFARQQRAQTTHKYQAARLELAIARELGALANGDEI